jgi:hypothetical protein
VCYAAITHRLFWAEMNLLASAFPLPTTTFAWLSLVFIILSPGLGMAIESPWWENYDRKDRYRCEQQQMLVIERNDSQASILMGGQRSTLFRDRRVDNTVSYSAEGLVLRLNGDELQLELNQPMPTLMRCQRTEDV